MSSSAASERYEVRTHTLSGVRAAAAWAGCIVASLLTRSDVVYAPLRVEICDRERGVVLKRTKTRLDSSVVETMERDLATMTAEEFAAEWNLT